MTKKEKSQLKVVFLEILFNVDGKNDQDKMIEILARYNDKFIDSKLRNFFDKIVLSSKKDYYDKVEFFVNDIFQNKFGQEESKNIQNMLVEIKPIFEIAERTFWEKVVGLFDWS